MSSGTGGFATAIAGTATTANPVPAKGLLQPGRKARHAGRACAIARLEPQKIAGFLSDVSPGCREHGAVY
jgi:hypothetical protein